MVSRSNSMAMGTIMHGESMVDMVTPSSPIDTCKEEGRSVVSG
jgi:hypothetical protein